MKLSQAEKYAQDPNRQIDEYIEQHSERQPEYLDNVVRETHLQMINPRMMSGHLQGRILKLLVDTGSRLCNIPLQGADRRVDIVGQGRKFSIGAHIDSYTQISVGDLCKRIIDLSQIVDNNTLKMKLPDDYMWETYKKEGR
jgi:hypothetical protein